MRTPKRLSPAAAAASAPVAPAMTASKGGATAKTTTPKAEQPSDQPAPLAETLTPDSQDAARMEILTAAKPEQDDATPAPTVPRVFTAAVQDLVTWMHDCNAISGRLQHFMTTRKELRDFNLGTDGRTDKITIQDGHGKVWSTSNSRTIERVRAVLLEELDRLIGETEAELREKALFAEAA